MFMSEMVSAPLPLSASFEGSFAYFTIKERTPVILTKIIDHLCREKSSICVEYGNVIEEIKYVVGQLSQLKNELQTNKSLTPFQIVSETALTNDSEIWNRALQSLEIQHSNVPKWFTTSWLFAECYFYKRIHETFLSTKSLKSYDPFRHQKVQSCIGASGNIKYLCDLLIKEVMQASTMTLNREKKLLRDIIEISLWGNQCDLSLSGGSQLLQENSPIAELEESRKNIIVSEDESFWEYLQKIRDEKQHMAIILDNSGLELVADLCLATLLMEMNLTSSVTLYVKSRPWFVSDTTAVDFNWALNYLRDSGGSMEEMSLKFVDYLKKGSWKIREHMFWTGPNDFAAMKKTDRQLYDELSQYSLLIFKGDLNYRKLVGDLDWPNGTDFRKALRGFLPAPMLVLRTIKGGPVVGLDESSAAVKELKSRENWATSGEIGMIQFMSNKCHYLRYFSILIVTSIFVLLISLFIMRFVL